ncbi:hypothetical protein NT6N_38150 [Oceaniferula spumae]|uniref:FAD-binding domain-containing protein n=1 Tax=Oceaniferula spumae TaxID=2979115 RepID=A0AAT9FRX7_9BACT
MSQQAAQLSKPMHTLQVQIVGTGPSGLVLALWLVKAGVACGPLNKGTTRTTIY